MLLFLCAPYANASKIETDCPHQRADQAEALALGGEALDARLGETAVERPGGGDRSTPADGSGDRVPSSSEFDAVMTRILDASILDRIEDQRQAADDADVSPLAEADLDSETADGARSDAEWASDSAHLPGLSDAAAERYRRQMYRTDI